MTIDKVGETPRIVRSAGCLALWEYKSCEAEMGIGEDWATVYLIESKEQGKGHATKLLLAMKKYYEDRGLIFGGSVALNDRMKRLYQKCQIHEYTSL